MMNDIILRVAGIDPESIVNGSGVRYTIYVQGCSHNCDGCHNPNTHDYDDVNKEYKDLSVDKIIDDYSRYASLSAGITLSGGDPLYSINLSSVEYLMSQFKSRYPDKTIWMYTGYRYEDIDDVRDMVNEYVDVLVDGPFIKELKSYDYKFRGSSNQRLIDVNKSVSSGTVVEL